MSEERKKARIIAQHSWQNEKHVFLVTIGSREAMTAEEIADTLQVIAKQVIDEAKDREERAP